MSGSSRAMWTILAALLTTACGGGGSTSGNNQAATSGGRAPTAESGGPSGAAGEREVLSDGQILAVIETIHESRIAEAALAKVRAQSEDVINYADSLSEEHQAAREAVVVLGEQRSLSSAESKTSRTIAASSSVEIDSLVSVARADFDRAFMLAQVKDHEKTLSIVDDLMSAVTDAELKASVVTLEAMAKSDQERAAAVHSGL